jgi:antitoxin HigA-1
MSKNSDIFHAPPGGFKLPPVHPGEIISEELEARGLSAHALALKLRVPANRVTEIINGKRGISAETALRFGRYFGNPAQFWMNLQASYDLAVAERDLGERVMREVEAA